mmetsp:Transcript_10097/g.19416  ORF Transcript_10097/g.19416 Transcript_10097/m.19416 type:complete len:207 (+) Transcript_10097:81-701(+)
MGNVCCGGKEESTKSTAFQSGFSVDSNSLDHSNNASAQAQSASAAQQHASSSHQQHDASSSGPARTTAETAEVDKETSEEESRLELLVQNAGRAMVAVHSTRGNNPYYDQGFAAALAQHLEQTTKFPTQLPPLPSTPDNNSSSVYARLSQPTWEDLQLGSQGGLAGCTGENPEKYLDRVAESFLDQVVPKKEQLFTKVKPIVESLL